MGKHGLPLNTTQKITDFLLSFPTAGDAVTTAYMNRLLEESTTKFSPISDGENQALTDMLHRDKSGRHILDLLRKMR